MKEASVLCNLYITMNDGESLEEAIDRILMMVDPDLGINIHKAEEVEN